MSVSLFWGVNFLLFVEFLLTESFWIRRAARAVTRSVARACPRTAPYNCTLVFIRALLLPSGSITQCGAGECACESSVQPTTRKVTHTLGYYRTEPNANARLSHTRLSSHRRYKINSVLSTGFRCSFPVVLNINRWLTHAIVCQREPDSSREWTSGGWERTKSLFAFVGDARNINVQERINSRWGGRAGLISLGTVTIGDLTIDLLRP